MLLKSFANVNIPLNLGWRWISPASPDYPRTDKKAHKFGAGNLAPGRIDMGSQISVHGYGSF